MGLKIAQNDPDAILLGHSVSACFTLENRASHRNFPENVSSLSLPREPLANLLDFLKDCFRKRSPAKSETGLVPRQRVRLGADPVGSRQDVILGRCLSLASC